MRPLRAIGVWLGLVDTPDRLCVQCNHPGDAHIHYRNGTDCGICECSHVFPPVPVVQLFST